MPHGGGLLLTATVVNDQWAREGEVLVLLVQPRIVGASKAEAPNP